MIKASLTVVSPRHYSVGLVFVGSALPTRYSKIMCNE